jgi:hypothetical protein
MKTLKVLTLEYNFDHQINYFEMIIDSYFNGNMSQCRELFNDMDNAGKREFMSYVMFTDLLPKDVKNITLFFINTILA